MHPLQLVVHAVLGVLSVVLALYVMENLEKTLTNVLMSVLNGACALINFAIVAHEWEGLSVS